MMGDYHPFRVHDLHYPFVGTCEKGIASKKATFLSCRRYSANMINFETLRV